MTWARSFTWTANPLLLNCYCVSKKEALSCLTKFGKCGPIFKFLLPLDLYDVRNIAKCWKRYNLSINRPIWMKLGWSHPTMSAMMRLPWQRPLPSNGALYIQKLWASGGRTREQIWMKFGTKQQVRTTMTVTWSNINIFKIQMADGHCWKIVEMP